MKNFRQVALTWPELDPGQALLAVRGPIRQTASAKSVEIGQTASAEFALSSDLRSNFPSLAARIATLQRLPWQDQAWTERLFASVTFSHLLELSRVDQALARAFYELEVLKEGWSVRELKRQVNSMLFERVGLSRDRGAVLALSREGRMVEEPGPILRDPYVLEFLGLPEPRVVFVSRTLTALPSEEQLTRWLHEERERLARGRSRSG